MLFPIFRGAIQEVYTEIRVGIYKYWYPQTNALGQALTDWLVRSSARELEHSWQGEVTQLEEDNRAMRTLSLSWNLIALHEASAFTAPISLGFFLFEIHRSCFTDLLNHPMTHICTLAIKIFSFLLSQQRQEVIRSALATERCVLRQACIETLR